MTEAGGTGTGPVWLRHYPPDVPAHLDYPNQMLHEVVGEAAARWPDRTALIFYGARWSYARLWSESGRFAAALEREGVRPGDRVALFLPNCPEYPIALLGALRAGAIVVQVSPLYFGTDLARLLADSQPKAVVTLEILYPALAKVRSDFAPSVVYVARLREFYPAHLRPFVNLRLRKQKLPTSFPDDPVVRRWSTAVRTPGTPTEFRSDPATTVAVLQYTGGTTGTPKAAMLSHRNLVANLTQGNHWNSRRRPGEEVFLASIPFFHIYGLTVALLMGLAEGATIVLQIRPEVRELLKLIDRYHPTQFPGVPALYQGLNQQPDLAKFDLRGIQFCVSGSAPLPRPVAERFCAITGANLVEGYGLTEASPMTHVNPLQGDRPPGSIGIPVSDTEERIVDLETGTRELPVGEAGELAVRGPQVMLGYYRQPEETARAIRDGWLLTGDIARLDENGFAYVVDRKKDVVNVGGMKVYPREVEDVLFQHPAVSDAAAVGIPDAALGEVVKAFVVRKPGATVTAEELIEFVRERIPHFKAPRSVEFRDALPRSGVQKVLRRQLRDSAGAPAPGVPSR